MTMVRILFARVGGFGCHRARPGAGRGAIDIEDQPKRVLQDVVLSFRLRCQDKTNSLRGLQDLVDELVIRDGTASGRL